MNTNCTRLTLLLFSALLVAACTPLSINQPTPEKSTLLVLPAEMVREAVRARYGFSYAYVIVGEDKSAQPYQAVFKLPVKNDMLIIDSLPPGNYTVSRFLTIPVGSGTRYFNPEGTPINYRFILESGKITIFSHSLRVHTYNEDPARGTETTYRVNMIRTTGQQKDDILEKLGALSNFSAWGVLGDTGTGTRSSPGSGQRKKFVVAERLQGGWSGTWRPITSDENAECIEGRLSFAIDGSRLSGDGADDDGNLYQISASLIDDGVVRGKISLNRVRVAKVTGRLYDNGTILGSFEYDHDCMAEWKARKN